MSALISTEEIDAVDYSEYGDNNDNENEISREPPTPENSTVPPVASGPNEDPRFKNGVKKFVKKGGVGRNTESFDPRSTLVRPDLRILVGTKEKKPSSLRHDDVMVIPNFFCSEDDWSIYNKLVHEMRDIQARGERGSEWISWHEGAHLISKNPSSSPTFQLILKQVADYFSISNSSVGTRFNWYRDSSDWKPFHHDSAAFNEQRAKNQNITVGVSFGVTRELAFLHARTNNRVYFPQTNGMLFSFGRDVNINWKHGVNFVSEDVQKSQESQFKVFCDDDVTVGRISIILWGLCGVTVEESGSPPMLSDNSRGNGHHMHRAKDSTRHERDGRAVSREGQLAVHHDRRDVRHDSSGFDRKTREDSRDRLHHVRDRGSRSDSRGRGDRAYPITQRQRSRSRDRADIKPAKAHYRHDRDSRR